MAANKEERKHIIESDLMYGYEVATTPIFLGDI